MSDCEDEEDISMDSPPKKTRKKHYDQKYLSSWEKDKVYGTWISKSNLGDYYFYCKGCRCDLKCGGGKCSLDKHASSLKHINSIKGLARQPCITSMVQPSSKSIDFKVKSAEIKLASFLAKNNLAFNLAGDLKDLVQSICPDSQIAKELTFERTKAHAIISNVTGVVAERALIKILQNNKFSMIVDESTDRGTIKHLAVVVRTAVNFEVKDNFLCLIPITDGSANALYSAITDYFSTKEIPYKDNMVGFAADGANVMFGAHHSLSKLFQKDIPKLFLMKCICHTFHLCASYACKKLPSIVEDFARDVYTYLKNSPKRIADYTEFQEYVNVKPHKLLHCSQTRWLSLLPVVNRLLEQLPALKLFFQGAVLTDNLLAARSILEKSLDPSLELYLNFLTFVIPFFHELNLEMQSERPKIFVIYERIFSVYKTILECFIQPELLQLTNQELDRNNSRTYLKNKILQLDFEVRENHVSIDEMYLGGNVSILLSSNDFIQKLGFDNATTFKENCLKFYVEAAKQIKDRFPFEDDERKKMESLKFLNPIYLIGSKRNEINSIAHVGKLFADLCPIAITELDREWRMLRNINLPFSNTESTRSEDFWRHIFNIKNSDETMKFPQLHKLVGRLMALPHSSANVERIFSAINLMKTNTRNRLNTNSLHGLLHTKSSENDPTNEHMKLFTKNMYK